MSRTNLLMLLGLIGAALLAWQLGGSMGVGVFGGYLLGASLFGLGHGWQRSVVRKRPEQSMNTLVILLMAKLLVLLVSWVTLRFVEGAAEHVDPKGFLLAYVTAVLLVSLSGSYDAMMILKNRKAQTP
jgi:peptidoglycan/LPS O-acetylase OafA/YrhL